MTKDKIIEVFSNCEATLRRYTGRAERLNAASTHVTDADRVSHFLWMAIAGRQLAEEGRIEKACRWLGFVQAGVWYTTGCSIGWLKNMNKPEDA